MTDLPKPARREISARMCEAVQVNLERVGISRVEARLRIAEWVIRRLLSDGMAADAVDHALCELTAAIAAEERRSTGAQPMAAAGFLATLRRMLQ